MDCTRFEDLLFEGLDSSLAAEDDERIRRHAATCSRCRELAALLGGSDDSESAQVPTDLVDVVLKRTSGSPCRRAQLVLADGTDGVSEVDDGLLSAHVEACVDCSAVARVLVRLRQELPALAELDPGDAFVADVMVATVGSATAPRAPLVVRIEHLWQRIAARPRLAFEGAYVVALVVFLAFGLPSRSMADLPGRAFDSLRQEGIEVERAVSTGVGELTELARTAWSNSTARAAGYFVAPSPADGASLERGVGFWKATARRLASSIWNGLLAPLVEQVRELLLGSPAARAELDENR